MSNSDIDYYEFEVEMIDPCYIILPSDLDAYRITYLIGSGPSFNNDWMDAFTTNDP